MTAYFSNTKIWISLIHRSRYIVKYPLDSLHQSETPTRRQRKSPWTSFWRLSTPCSAATPHSDASSYVYLCSDNLSPSAPQATPRSRLGAAATVGGDAMQTHWLRPGEGEVGGSHSHPEDPPPGGRSCLRVPRPSPPRRAPPTLLGGPRFSSHCTLFPNRNHCRYVRWD